jgi:leucine-rich repeat protein SHOC2
MDDMGLVLKRLGDNLEAVDSLNLSNRNLKELPSFIASMKQLKFLYLDNNKLIFVPEIGKLTQLEEISIENNDLTLIPEDFNNLRNIKLMNLSKNHFKCLSSNLFGNLVNLTTLWMNNCELMYLPKEIGTLKSLEKLGKYYLEKKT